MVQCIQTVLGNAVTVTTCAPVYSSNENPTEQNKEEEEESDEDHPRKVAPLLTHVRTLFSLKYLIFNRVLIIILLLDMCVYHYGYIFDL